MNSIRSDITAIVWVGLVAAVVEAHASIQVLTPQGGEVFLAGNPITVTWSATNPVGNVDVVLRKGGRDYVSLADVPLSAGQAAWELCSFLSDGADYSVALLAADGSVLGSTSNFTITGSVPSPTLAVAFPAGGETLPCGEMPPISWSASSVSTQQVYVDLLQGGQFVRTLACVPMFAGQCKWQYCTEVGGNDYSIRISTDGCGREIVAASLPFAIVPRTATAAPTITQPVAGTTWGAGTTQRITWTAESGAAGPAEIVLLKAGQRYAYLGTPSVADGQFDWAICPELPAGADYAIQITRFSTCGDSSVQAIGGPITIASTAVLPTLTLLQPRGGEVWTAGSPVSVEWQTDAAGGSLLAGLAIGGQWQMALGTAPLNTGILNVALPDNLRGDSYEVVLRSKTCGGSVTAASAPLLASPAPKSVVSIAEWRSVRSHSGIGDIPLVLDAVPAGYFNGDPAELHPTVESRGTPARGVGIRKIELVFDGPITLVNPGVVRITGYVSGVSSVFPISSIAVEGPATLALYCTLPDLGCFTITLPPETIAETLVGDTSCMVRTMAGDADGSGNVTEADMAWIKNHIGQSARLYPQADFNLDGKIDVVDMAFSRARRGRVANCPRYIGPQ